MNIIGLIIGMLLFSMERRPYFGVFFIPLADACKNSIGELEEVDNIKGSDVMEADSEDRKVINKYNH